MRTDHSAERERKLNVYFMEISFDSSLSMKIEQMALGNQLTIYDLFYFEASLT